MRTLYLDLSMGAAGDMLTAALLELLPEAEQSAFLEQANRLGLPGVAVSREKAVKQGITGTHMRILVNGREEGAQMEAHHEYHHHEHEHHHEHGCGESGEHHHHEHHHEHHHLADIQRIVRQMPVSDRVKEDVMSVYSLIAEAESKAHGKPVEEIHFHEVGAMDAVADVTLVSMLMERLKPQQVIASPVHTGSGTVTCAHGIMPVPAPATAHILKGVPMYGGAVQGELCTPTGAALVRHFADRFGEMPVMVTEAIGYGMGQKDFPQANCLRAFLGETEDAEDTVLGLQCNVDDMTGEELGFAMEQLLAGGALEAYCQPVMMKKSRPGYLLNVLCRPSDKERMLKLIFLHTETIGVRETSYRRNVLDRQPETVDTCFGPVRRKVSRGFGVQRVKWEMDDLSRIAEEQGLSLRQVKARLEQV